ncbi:hypothetical protein [Butyrivibrio sp. AC2005]|nr:hypothetical protein [Butyrivibrio sp. AC2005]
MLKLIKKVKEMILTKRIGSCKENVEKGGIYTPFSTDIIVRA